MKKIILFGASVFGQKALPYWLQKKGFKVIAFSDNNQIIHHTSINNILVLPPEEIINLDFDKIIITSSYDEEIKKQLIKMGISKRKIEI